MKDATTLQVEHLRQLLKEQGLYQYELAAVLGTTEVTVSRWATGHQPIAKKNAQKIHERWPEYRVEWLLGLVEENDPLALPLKELGAKMDRFERIDAAVRTLVRDSGHQLGEIESDRYFESDSGERVHASDFKLSRKGEGVTLTDTQWNDLKDEVLAYVGMRVEQIIARGRW